MNGIWSIDNTEFYAHPYSDDEVAELLERFGLTSSPIPALPVEISTAEFDIEIYANSPAANDDAFDDPDIYQRTFHATRRS